MSNRIRLIFIVGVVSEEENDSTINLLTEIVKNESETHGDILQVNITESYLNISMKFASLLEYKLKYCSSVRFLFKGDDDIFLNPDKLYAKLPYLREQEREMGLFMFGGNISKAGPLRDKNTHMKFKKEDIEKWTVPEYIYSCKYWGFHYLAGIIVIFCFFISIN